MDDSTEKDNDGRTWIHHSVRKNEPLAMFESIIIS